jgi:hypothetical protein
MAAQNPKPTSGLLIGKKAITAYLDISCDAFATFIKLGMPATIINNRYYAHQENLELWFRAITRQQNQDIDVTAE